MSDNINTMTKFLRRTAIISIVAIICFVLVSLSEYIISSKYHPLDDDNHDISIQYSYLLTDNNNDSVEQIRNQLSQFTKTDKHGIPYGLVEQTYWVSLKINKFSPSLNNMILHADNAMLNTLDIFDISTTKDTVRIFSLENLPDSNIKSQVFPHTKINFLTGTKRHLLIKLNTYGPPDVPFEFYSEEAFAERVELSQLVFGAFIGIILLMGIYNLVFYCAVKNKIYLLYVGYLLAVFFTMSTINGFGFYLFSSRIQHYLSDIIITLHYLLMIFLLLFTVYFLNYEQDKTKHYRNALIVTSCLLLIAIVTTPLNAIIEARIFFSIAPIYFLYLVYLLIRKIKVSFAWSRYYFLSWIPLFFGSTFQPLVHLNILESNFVSGHAFLFAVMIEVIFLAFALAERMKKTELDRLNDICYHTDSNLPRKGNLERCIIEQINLKKKTLSIIVIKPEHIEKISLYINDYFNTQFFINLTNSIHSLVKYNDAVLPITQKLEKIAYIEPYSLGLVIDDQVNNQTIEEFIKSVQHKVNESYKVKDLNLPLYANIGLSCYPENSINPQILLNEAQLAANKAMDTLDGWQRFDNKSERKDDYLLNLASDMADAIDNNEFEIYHQPQIDLKTLRVCGSECLIRWYYQGEGFVSPTVFIPIAEDIGLIKKLTRWVIKHSLMQHNEIMGHNHKNHMISINISGKDITDNDFVSFIKSALIEADIPADKVILELTESAVITDNPTGIAIMNELIALGITMSIDDFGTGYSSMSYMSLLPCQELKVDREFVENIKEHAKNKVICETTVKMAKGLKLEVVAEGINSQSDEDILRSFGCDIGQGYYYAKPMPIEHYLVWLDKQINGRLPEGEQI